MIIKTEPSDIFKQNAKHIAFAINTEGFNVMTLVLQVKLQELLGQN